MAARLQKQKDAEEAAAAQAALGSTTLLPTTSQMSSDLSFSHSHALHTRHVDNYPVHTGHVEIHTGDSDGRCFGGIYSSQPAARDVAEVEREHLRRISDRIDECMMRAARVEQHWNSSVQTILKLLGHNEEMEKKSYV